MVDDWNNSLGDILGVEWKLWYNYFFRSCLEVFNINYIMFYKIFLIFWVNYVFKIIFKGDIFEFFGCYI